MPIYIQRGKIPQRRHTVFKSPQGKHHYEEHISRLGFSDIYSNVYHIHMPTRVAKVGKFRPITLEAIEGEHRHRHLKTFDLKPEGDWVTGRRPMMFNTDIAMGTISPVKGNGEYFYKNADQRRSLFIHKGQGHAGEHVRAAPVRRGRLRRHSARGHSQDDVRERQQPRVLRRVAGPVDRPKQYRNQYGQLLETRHTASATFAAPSLSRRPTRWASSRCTFACRAASRNTCGATIRSTWSATTASTIRGSSTSKTTCRR